MKKTKLEQPKDSALIDVDSGKFLHWNSKDDMWGLAEFTAPKKAKKLASILQSLIETRGKFESNEAYFSIELSMETLKNLKLVKVKLIPLEETK